MEKIFNSLTDMDWGWFPFKSLRPQKNELMSNSLLLKMSFAFGGLYGILYFLYLQKTQQLALNPDGFKIIGFLIVGFFFGYKSTFAHFWNKRALRLQKESE